MTILVAAFVLFVFLICIASRSEMKYIDLCHTIGVSSSDHEHAIKTVLEMKCKLAAYQRDERLKQHTDKAMS